MQRSQVIEPGLLQVFRFYAWLRVPVVIFFIAALLRAPYIPEHRPAPPPASPAFIAFIIFHTLLLLAALHWAWLERAMQRWYFPALLALATAGLLVEQHLTFFQRIAWEAAPFLYILLILAAWQFRLRGVVFYTLAAGALDVALNMLAPMRMMVVGPPNGELRDVLIYVGIVSRYVTFLVVGYVVSRLVQAQRLQRRQLAEANRHLVSHAATLEQLATTRERVRLSRDLHDTLAHTLSAQAVQLDAVLTVWKDIPPRAQQMLERSLAATRLGLDETRRALRDLRAAPLEETGLVQSLRALAEDFAQRHSLELELILPDHADGLPPEVEQTIYRVAQEALENAARHASAHRLSVALRATPTQAALHIADDGSGFDPHTAAAGLGLQGMRERAEIIGARLNLHSRPGEGAQIDLTWEAA
jgi:signal transduction histidine kinase